jgi:hypothetical protein
MLPAAALALSVVACTAARANRMESTGSPSATIPVASPSPSATPSPSPPSLPARFVGAVSAIPPDLAARMRGTTWQPGCPVPIARLRLLTLRYWGFDGLVHEGPMVLNRSVARDVLSVFRRLFRARFRIKDMHLAVKYRPGHEDPNDTSDHTDAFNCRPVVTARGPLDIVSQHSYGWAIDINPIQNPYVTFDGYVRNNHARAYRDRALMKPGMIHAGDVVVRAFASIGWKWGGYWSGDKDYMHFSLTGK